MAQSFRYLHYDVFTDLLFAGNQLAVLPDARGLSGERMQQIAAEMAFSETTFVLPAEHPDTDARMRIFTPRAELPLAGHPTVGSAFALAHEGVIEPNQGAFTFGLGVGPTPLALVWTDDRLSFVWMTQPVPDFEGAADDPVAVAAALRLDTTEIANDGPAAQVVTCGVPMLFAGLSDRAAVDRASLDRQALRHLLASLGSEEIPTFVFTLEPDSECDSDRDSGPEHQPPTAYCRMFAPTFGIEEDPATGGASGPLGGYLVHHGLVERRPRVDIINRQGVAMGRPSRIDISVESAGDTITRVRVGGQAVLVAEGVLKV